MNYSIISKNTEVFSKIEIKLYERYPRYKESENNFFVGARKINKNKTLKQNNIKNNDIITLKIQNYY